MAQQTQVTEEQARALAEESRESGWDKPSFAKELFLGRFPLGLIHPFPKPSDAEEARTEAFWSNCGNSSTPWTAASSSVLPRSPTST